MIHLDNDVVLDLLPMREVIDALRIGLEELADGEAAHVPRLELWAPTPSADSYHCLGTMSGTVKHFGVSALRVKSDVLSWQGGRQEKYALEPGNYCGFVLLFSSETGAPLALVNDGVVQRMRVGGSAAIGVDVLAKPAASHVGVLGAGDMARSYLEAISLVRRLDHVRVFSPTVRNREDYAEEMTELLSVPVTAVDTAEEAITGAEIAVTATNSMVPTLQPEWLAKGSLAVCVSRRELGTSVVDQADGVYQLGEFTIGPKSGVPGLEHPQSGAGGFVAGSTRERSRLPWAHTVETRSFPNLVDVLQGSNPGRTSDKDRILFVNTGLQGIQFASVVGRLYQLAGSLGLGEPMAQSRFMQQIRD